MRGGLCITRGPGSRCTRLRVLDLSFNNIGQGGLEGTKAIAEALRVNASLAEFDVRNNNISDEAMRAMGSSLLSSTTSKLGALKCDNFDVPAAATSLNLSGKQIGPGAATLLAGVVKFNAGWRSEYVYHFCEKRMG